MTLHSITMENETDTEHITEPAAQVVTTLFWKSREKWYPISVFTAVHNEGFPTPAISVIAPAPGIRFTVYNQDGELVYSNKKEKE